MTSVYLGCFQSPVFSGQLEEAYALLSHNGINWHNPVRPDGIITADDINTVSELVAEEEPKNVFIQYGDYFLQQSLSMGPLSTAARNVNAKVYFLVDPNRQHTSVAYMRKFNYTFPIISYQYGASPQASTMSPPWSLTMQDAVARAIITQNAQSGGGRRRRKTLRRKTLRRKTSRRKAANRKHKKTRRTRRTRRN
jgi:hypothetical protein